MTFFHLENLRFSRVLRTRNRLVRSGRHFIHSLLARLGRAARLRPFLPVCSGLSPIPATTPQLYRTNLVGTNGTRTLVFARYLAAS